MFLDSRVLQRPSSAVCADLHVHVVSVGRTFGGPEEFWEQEHASLEAVFSPPLGDCGLPASLYRRHSGVIPGSKHFRLSCDVMYTYRILYIVIILLIQSRTK